MRQFFLHRGVTMPSNDIVRTERNELLPKLENCHEDGVWAPLPDLFCRVTKSILENLVVITPELANQIEMGISVRATCGFDGNGNNSVSRSCRKQDSSIIIGGIKVFSIDGPDQNIFLEKSSGHETETPWFLLPSKKICTCFSIKRWH